jgi:ribonuclease P protein component
MHRARLQKHAKLLKADEFDRVFKQSVRSSDQYFTVLARPSERAYPRLGLAISKKRVRLAVGRNRLKRLIRETFRLSERSTCADYVVMAGSKAAKASNTELLIALEKHWKILKEKCADS